MTHLCSYCLDQRDDLEGWHGCSQSMDAKTRIDDLITSMSRVAEGKSLKPEPVIDEVYIGRQIKGIKFYDDNEARLGKDYDGGD